MRDNWLLRDWTCIDSSLYKTSKKKKDCITDLVHMTIERVQSERPKIGESSGSLRLANHCEWLVLTTQSLDDNSYYTSKDEVTERWVVTITFPNVFSREITNARSPPKFKISHLEFTRVGSILLILWHTWTLLLLSYIWVTPWNNNSFFLHLKVGSKMVLLPFTRSHHIHCWVQKDIYYSIC